MTGTLINTATVLVGSTVGTFLRSRFPDRVRQMVMWGVGLISLVIGVQMSLTTKNILIVLGSLLAGGILLDLTTIRVATFLPALAIAPLVVALLQLSGA